MFSNVSFVKKIYDNYLEPSQQQLIILLEHYKAGRYDDAEKLSLSITKQFPKHQFAWKVLGAVLKQNGKIDESLIVTEKCLQLNPGDAEANNNLGVLLQDKGKFKEAETSFRQAIKLKSNYVEALFNLGYSQQRLGRLKEAEINYKKAIVLKPSFTKAYNNLGIVLKDLGNLSEACSAYAQAIILNPNFNDAYVNLGIAIKSIRFNSSNVKLYPILIQLINMGNFARPKDLAPSILSLLKNDPVIKNLLIEENFPKNLKEVSSIIFSLDKIRIVHYLMRICPLPDLQFEKFFSNIRSLILTYIDDIKTSPQFIYFLTTLSLHCFTNEYIYFEKEKETQMVEKLENEIIQTFMKSEQPDAKKVLCLASYRPLHEYNWCEKLETLDNIENVKLRLIEEPSAERKMMTKIPIIGEISDEVSRKVRMQYEQSPYPRWVKTEIPTKAKSISEICTEVNLHLHSNNIKKIFAPEILIAGCGTGQHSIVVASQFSKSKVTAIDLSLASLAYAKRKTIELGITNIEYLQADILRLEKLDKKFDIIESVGVLHHMDEPLAGWRVLTDLLKPGGLIKVGLYSEFDRKYITEIRKEISLLKVGTSETEIRKFRQSLIESNDNNHKRLNKSSDFFSLSSLRDLIFHEQEHHFTLSQIKDSLHELGLKFCGFMNKEAISNFRGFNGKDANIYDLSLWHDYEKSNPRAFAAMYQFWCQKI